MRRAFDFGERVGLELSLVLWIAWVLGGAAVTRHSGKVLTPHWLAIVVILLISVIAGTGGLIGYWVIADLVDFRRLGHRVKFVAGSEWLYEERQSCGSVRSFRFTCNRLGGGYPAPCEVQIPNDALWPEWAPVWAHSRQAEIKEHIAYCFGAGVGGRVQFVELTVIRQK